MTVVNYDKRLSEYGYTTDRAIGVFELEPMLVFRCSSGWQISDITNDREWLRPRRQTGAGLLPEMMEK